MKKIMTAIAVVILGLTTQAQTWVAPITPVVVTVNAIKVDMVSISITTNMVARGMIGVSKMSGSNVISRAGVPLTPADITALLTTCGTTMGQLGTSLLQAGGQTNKFIERLYVDVNQYNNQAMVRLSIAGTNRPVIINNAQITTALGGVEGVAAFRTAFVNFAKQNVK